MAAKARFLGPSMPHERLRQSIPVDLKSTLEPAQSLFAPTFSETLQLFQLAMTRGLDRRPLGFGQTVRLSVFTMQAIGKSPPLDNVVDVLAASVLAVTDDRLLFHFEDSSGNGREGWLPRTTVPLRVEVGDLLQVLILSDGRETRLKWQFFEPPSAEDYQRSLDGLPVVVDSGS